MIAAPPSEKQGNPKRRRSRARVRRRNPWSTGKIIGTVIGVGVVAAAAVYGVKYMRARKVIGGAPGTTKGATEGPEGVGPEGAGAPFVGSGWSWPHRDVFPTEPDFLVFLNRLTYDTSASSVLSPQNKAAVKEFQQDWNTGSQYIKDHLQGSQINSLPDHLVADGLIGLATVQVMWALAGSGAGMGDNFVTAFWIPAISPSEGPQIPTFVTKLQGLGYINFLSEWTSGSASHKSNILKKFQREYNCVIKETDNTPIAVDGLAGPKTTNALDYALSYEKLNAEDSAQPDWLQIRALSGCLL